MINKIKTLFNKKHTYSQHYRVDIHSHLIPGIDDGAKTMQESVALVKSLKDLGFKKLVTTPHIMNHRYPNTREIILSGLENLKKELALAEIDIIVEAAAEYYLDEHFVELLHKKEILTFGDNYLLFETSYSLKPVNLEQTIFLIKSMGYKPVLAHPERYLYMHRDFNIYERLKENGVYFQLNLNSLGGYYSKAVEKVAKKIVKKGWVDFIGSDTHKQSHVQKFTKKFNSKSMRQVCEKNTILNSQLL